MSTHPPRSLPSSRGRVSLIVCACVLLVLVGCDRQRPKSDQVLDSLVAANPCTGSLPKVTRAPDSLTQSQSCALLVAAMRQLARAGPSDLPQSPDTSGVTGATIDAMSERDFSDRQKGAWWVVTLRLQGAQFNAEVRFDRQTGAAGIRPVHK